MLIRLLSVVAIGALPAFPQQIFRDTFATAGTKLDLGSWTTEFICPGSPVNPSYLGRTQLADWVTPNGKGQFVVGPGGAQLALHTFNPTGFSLYGTHAKTITAFPPTANSTIEFTTRLQLTSLQRGIVYGMYLYRIPVPCDTQHTEHDEIDIELVTNLLQPGAPPMVQLNRYANEPLGAGSGSLVNLPVGFDPLASHDWTIRWSLTRIDYLVDGVLLGSATTHVPQGPMQVNVIAWGPYTDWAAAYDPSLQPANGQTPDQSFVALLKSVTVNRLVDGTFTLSVARNGTGGGTVVGGQINCGAVCSANLNAGAMVSLSATPASGSTFAGWSGACSGAAACNVTMDAAKSVTATFDAIPQQFLLSVSKSGTGGGTVSGGSINCGVSCSANLDSGAVVSLNATASPGSTFAGWSGACSGAGLCNVAMDAAKSVIATFNVVLTPGGGLRFVPITPCRVVETRSLYAGTTWSGLFGPPRLSANVTRTIPITASPHCSIPATAKAFVFNVTLDTLQDGTGPVDFVTVWPTGEARPNFWTARTTTGGYIANSAIVKAGTNGSVDVFSSNNVNLLLDINGYFTDDGGAQGLLFYPIGPCRAVDTRGPIYSSLPPPYGNQKFTDGETRTLRIPTSPIATPNCQIPAAAAYSLQMTLAPGDLTNGAPVAFVTAWPSGQPQPSISNMNSIFGYALANSGIVPARSDGSIDVFAFNTTNIILDVNGYFGPEDGTGRGLSYFPVTQCRIVNTQDGSYTGAFGPPQMTAAVDRVVTIPNSQQCPGLPATAKAWALNATAIPNGVAMPFLSMWPDGTPWPVVSQLNAFQGQTVSNSAIVPVSASGAILVKVNNTTHVAIEVAGYFGR